MYLYGLKIGLKFVQNDEETDCRGLGFPWLQTAAVRPRQPLKVAVARGGAVGRPRHFNRGTFLSLGVPLACRGGELELGNHGGLEELELWEKRAWRPEIGGKWIGGRHAVVLGEKPVETAPKNYRKRPG